VIVLHVCLIAFNSAVTVLHHVLFGLPHFLQAKMVCFSVVLCINMFWLLMYAGYFAKLLYFASLIYTSFQNIFSEFVLICLCQTAMVLILFLSDVIVN